MIECVFDADALLGECPVWSSDEAVLYWVDIEGRLLHRFDPATGLDEERKVPGRPGSFALSGTPGRFLVAVEHRLGWYDWETARFDEWVDLEEAGTGNRLNDGRCDPAGRFWVESMWERTSDGRFTGMLHRVEPDGSAVITRRNIGVSNGLAFSPDGRTMYFADTLHQKIWAYDYDVDTGAATNEIVFADYTHLPGRLDGGCVDADGCYWGASVNGWAVIRVTPDGRLDRRIELPVQKPSMCAFGGAELDVLYVTSIATHITEERSVRQQCVGGVLAVDAGIPEPRFAGPKASREESLGE